MWVNFAEDLIVTGVSYGYQNSCKTHPRAKKVPFVYGYTSQGTFKKFRVPRYLVPLWRTRIQKVKKFPCGHKLAGEAAKGRSCPLCVN